MNSHPFGNSKQAITPFAGQGGYFSQMDSSESTHEFVEKLHDTQKKDKRNKKLQNEEQPGNKLPGKQHSTNK